MSSVQFYGNKRYDLDLRDYDVVFTTYTLVTLDYDEPLEKDQNPKRKRRTFMNGTQSQDESEDENKNKKKKKQRDANKRKKLFNLVWHRVVIDEGHKIANKKSLVSQAVCSLKCTNRWILTGTPISNDMNSLFPFMKFLKHYPWDNWGEFNDTLAKP